MAKTPAWGAPLTPYLAVNDGQNAIHFYTEAFGAEVTVGPLVVPGGLIAHAEMRIGDAAIMLADGGLPGEKVETPTDLGASTMQLHLYVDDVDAVFAAALAAGAEVVRPMQDSFDGRRTCKIRDPFGHNWFLATQITDMTLDEVNQGLADLLG